MSVKRLILLRETSLTGLSLLAVVVSVIYRCLIKFPDQRLGRAQDLDNALAACACAGKWTDRDAANWWETHPKKDPGTGTDLNSLALSESLSD